MYINFQEEVDTMNFETSKPWLPQQDLLKIVSSMNTFGLIKYDPTGELPLKCGDCTDIYVNLRNARSDPDALWFIADLFVLPLRSLIVNRFIEIPQSVSCIAGPLAISAGIPYLTFRDKPKEGRVSDARVIGEYEPNDRVCIIDDVITDGASKVDPVRLCQELGLTNVAIVVLVDRQQGWQELFAKEGIEATVWAGMTLDDMRTCLKTL